MIRKQINLVIIDGHPGVRKGISELLTTAKDIVVVGEGENGAQAIQLALDKKPRIMLLNTELSDLRGTAVIRCLHAILPGIKIVAISSYSDSQLILGMMDNGASGYLTKDKIPARLINTIRSIAYEKNNWIGPRIKTNYDLHSKFEQTLTPKEVDILKQLAFERSENSIAIKLGIDRGRVRDYLELLMEKYQAKTLSELRFIARQIFTPERLGGSLRSFHTQFR